jgi:hypothetical protein
MMGTLILNAAQGSVRATAGGLIGHGVGSLLGGGPIGSMFGRIAGQAFSAALSDHRTRLHDGPRLHDMPVMGATEGAPIPKVYGRARIGGTLIWATRFAEVITQTETETGSGGTSGGLGFKGGGGGSSTLNRTYSYYGNFAVAVCEGPVAFIRRIWADGQLLDHQAVTLRIYRGDESQQPDPLIVAKEGAANTPAFRGTCYVVFERMPLAAFGNRLPQLSFEVVRPVNGIGQKIRSINLIPGSGEFVYGVTATSRDFGQGNSQSENRHDLSGASDWMVSLDALQALCPNLQHVQLVVSWFGDDLRCDSCTVAPRIEMAGKATIGAQWTVAGLARVGARTVSQINGRAAYGGTPSDQSVMEAITDLHRRGLAVTLYPFLMMDIPPDNTLPDPWSGTDRQAAYPWRGRISCSPAPGQAGSPDGTLAAATAVQKFFGNATAAQFSYRNGVVFSGGAEWSWRRMVLHYATLAKAAGGVNGFIIGSEFVTLNHIRSGIGTFPGPIAFARLANEVQSVLGTATVLTYAADWTEYGGYSPGAGELRFPLDVLWAHPAIGAVGIDAYWPVCDWRDGNQHRDLAQAETIYDPAYLSTGMISGENFDWYYASPSDRQAQLRTPITDGRINKPWVWRAKDIQGWWSNQHFERLNGSEYANPTPWQPFSKPIWMTEIGCPAVDKGANAPNVFPDPKSSEAALPPFSLGERDDVMLLRFIEAVLLAFDPHQGADASRNPTSPVYGGRMIDADRISFWAWDTRPFPAFPMMGDVWADNGNWQTGHWLTGRLESISLDGLMKSMLDDAGLSVALTGRIDEVIDGYVADHPMSVAEMVAPLCDLLDIEVAVTGAGLRLLASKRKPVAQLMRDDCVALPNGALFEHHRKRETGLPSELALSFTESEADYRRAVVSSRRLTGRVGHKALAEFALVTRRCEAQRMADTWLHRLWTSRDEVTFALTPRWIGLEVGDVVMLPVSDLAGTFVITSIREQGTRLITARAIADTIGKARPVSMPALHMSAPKLASRPWVAIFDLPITMGSPVVMQVIAGFADPWPASLTVWRSADAVSYDPVLTLDAPARIGKLLGDCPAGRLWVWDESCSLTIELQGGVLTSPGDLNGLSGSPALAIEGADGTWEVISFARAELVGPKQWRLSRLLRGLGGSELAAQRFVAAGARCVVLDRAVKPLRQGLSALGEVWHWRVAASHLDYSDTMAVALDSTVSGAALIPLSPVGLTTKRTPQGIVLNWIRRARSDADGWGVSDIPMDEDVEAYQVSIIKQGQTIRQMMVSTTSCLYAATDEWADFGQAQSRLWVSIRQISSAVGPGAALTAQATILS